LETVGGHEMSHQASDDVERGHDMTENLTAAPTGLAKSTLIAKR
jgi:hypothetical protein